MLYRANSSESRNINKSGIGTPNHLTEPEDFSRNRRYSNQGAIPSLKRGESKELQSSLRMNEDLSPMAIAKKLINQNNEETRENKIKDKAIQKPMIAQGNPSLFNVRSTKNIQKKLIPSIQPYNESRRESAAPSLDSQYKSFHVKLNGVSSQSNSKKSAIKILKSKITKPSLPLTSNYKFQRKPDTSDSLIQSSFHMTVSQTPQADSVQSPPSIVSDNLLKIIEMSRRKSVFENCEEPPSNLKDMKKSRRRVIKRYMYKKLKEKDSSDSNSHSKAVNSQPSSCKQIPQINFDQQQNDEVEETTKAKKSLFRSRENLECIDEANNDEPTPTSRNTEKLILDSMKKLEDMDKKIEKLEEVSPKIKVEMEHTWGNEIPKFNDTW